MARAHFYKVLLNTNGTPLTGASVSVRNTSDIAIGDTLFLLESGSGSLANPFTSASGVIEFYLTTPQRVHLHYTPPGGAETIVVVDVNPSADVIPSSTFDPTAINATVAGHTSTLATHTSQIATLTTNEATDATNIGTLNTTVGGHTTSIAANASAITATNGNVSTLSTTVAGHTTSIGTLTTAVGTLAGMSAAAPVLPALTGAAGTSNAAARGDHIHPRGIWSPEDNGVVASSCDPQYIPGGNLLSGGVIQLVQLVVPKGFTAGKLYYGIQAVGVTLTASQCWAALLNASGTIIATPVDQTTTFAGTTGLKPVTLAAAFGGSLALTAGQVVYAAFLCNGTTQVTLWSQGTQQSAANMNLVAPNFRFCSSGTGQTTITAVTMSGTASTRPYFAALGV